MTTTEELAEFAGSVSYDDLTGEVREELKKRVLDSIGIAVGAMGEESTEIVRETVAETASVPASAAGEGNGNEKNGTCRLWGTDSRSSPPGAAMYNTSLTRYLDFMDSFLAPGETPHPSDNIAGIVACGESAGASGQELIEAIGVAYEVQGELAWNAPVRNRGFDHVTHTVISTATGAGKVMGLDTEPLRNGIGIAGTAHNALRVTRTGGINEWKGIASANAARNAVYSALLGENGMEGPVNLFEGQKGWKGVISGDFAVDLDPGCERVFDTMTKRYVAETYAQSAVEGIIELAKGEDIEGEEVEGIRLDTFAGAKLIIGGGEGSRYEVETKAQADHSLPYMLAAALIDGELTNEAYDRERIQAEDVQSLLRTVEVEEDEALTERFEAGEMPANLTVTMADGSVHEIAKDDFAGHPQNPMSWEQVIEKFETMTEDRYDENRRAEIVDVVRNLASHDVADLVALID